MTGEELFDIFCGGQVSKAEVAEMRLETVYQHVYELRQEDDDIDMSDHQIAVAILTFACN